MTAGRFVLAALAVALAANGASAQSDVPLPRPRPVIEAPEATAAWAADAEARFDAAQSERTADMVQGGGSRAGAAPLPRPRPVTQPASVTDVTTVTPPLLEPAPAGEPAHEPDAAERGMPDAPHALAAIDAMAPLPRPRPDNPEMAMIAPPRINRDLTIMSADDPACLDKLRALGVSFTEEAPLDPGGVCEVQHPLSVTSFGSGVSVAPETLLNCATTLATAEWVRDTLVPEAKRIIGKAPSGIRQDSAYVCRNRYNDPDAKISEHARANALDIAAIEFEGREPVAVGRSNDATEARFEAAIRAGSCEHFTTVLGPGSNAAHATHFHFDLAHRRGGYRLCELGAPSEVSAKAKRE